MKRLLNMDIKTVAIIVLCVFLLLRNCTNGDTTTGEIVKVDGKKYELVEQKIDTVFIEKTVKVPTYVPKYITKEVIKEVQIPADIDSLAVIKDYYSKVTVRDTLQLNYDFPEEVKDSLVDQNTQQIKNSNQEMWIGTLKYLQYITLRLLKTYRKHNYITDLI